MNQPPIYIQDYRAICAAGDTLESLRDALFSEAAPDYGSYTHDYSPSKSLYLGQINRIDQLPADTPQVFRNRNNAMIYTVVRQLRETWDAHTQGISPTRLGVVIGSSNSGIEAGEQAVAHFEAGHGFPEGYAYPQQEYGSPTLFLSHLLNIKGPSFVISTACSSSAKAFISGARLIQSGICDVVLVGGADTLCQLTVNGFLSLDAVDGGRCNPFSANRKGIHLGEAAALFILSKIPSPIRLAGWGESSDAYHMSAPEPEGRGAEASMLQALKHAQLSATDIDYINLHGTATPHNDHMESLAVARALGNQQWASSTKPLTGHTLGAAGAIEAAFSCLTLSPTFNPNRQVPTHWWDGAADPTGAALKFAPPQSVVERPIQYVLSNSFGFGGSNATLILAHEA